MISVLRVAEWLRRGALACGRALVFLIALALIPLGLVLLVEISDGEILAWAFSNRRVATALPSLVRDAFYLHVVDPTREESKRPIDQSQFPLLNLV